MEKMARFRCSASTSLNWGEGCFYFLFYSVQDCRSYTESVSSIDRALFDNLVFSGLISIDRQMIDQRALFDNLVVSGSIWSVRKDLELDLILFILKSSRKRLTFNPRAKRLHTTGESTLSPGELDTRGLDIGRNDLLPGSLALRHTKIKLAPVSCGSSH